MIVYRVLQPWLVQEGVVLQYLGIGRSLTLEHSDGTVFSGLTGVAAIMRPKQGSPKRSTEVKK